MAIKVLGRNRAVTDCVPTMPSFTPYLVFLAMMAVFSKLAHLDLSEQIYDIQPISNGLGTSCDMFTAYLRPGNTKVAVKRLRVLLTEGDNININVRNLLAAILLLFNSLDVEFGQRIVRPVETRAQERAAFARVLFGGWRTSASRDRMDGERYFA